MLEYDVLIVGAGHAGAQLAFALRQQKFEGSIALVGDEPHAPYEPSAGGMCACWLSQKRVFHTVFRTPLKAETRKCER